MADAEAHKELVLLPGMMCDERLWQPQIKALTGHCRLHVPSITGANTINGIAAGLLKVLPSAFCLAGLSMGGIVALEMWRQAPGRIRRLALLDTNCHADSPARRELRNEQIGKARQGQLWSLLREELKPQYLAANRQQDPTLLDEIMAMGMAAGPATFILQSEALRDRADQEAVLPTIDCPTLVLCGDQDRLCPTQLHESMADMIRGSTLKIIADCGHLPTLEKPEEVTRAMYQWLAEDHRNRP